MCCGTTIMSLFLQVMSATIKLMEIQSTPIIILPFPTFPLYQLALCQPHIFPK